MAAVIIAGGGIAGLSAALAAADAGHDVTVLEQAPAFEEIGAGIQMGPNGRRALEALGAWERVAPHVVHPSAIRIRRAGDGARLGIVPTDAAFEKRFGSTYQVVHRSDLLSALVAAARERGRIVLRTGCRVENYRAESGGVAAVSDACDSVVGDILIGADGIRSNIRAQLLGDGPPTFAGHVLYRALVDVSDVPDTVNARDVTLWLHKGGHVVHYPVSGGRKFNIVASINENWDGGSLSEPTRGNILRKVFADVAAPLRAALEAPSRWLRWVGGDREPTSSWGLGPVTLIGDAAHPTLPYLASGAVMALEDAVVLGRELRAAAGGDPLPALRAYEAARQPRTARIVKSSHKLAGVYHASQPLAFLRDQFIRFSSGPRSLERMAWLYDWRP